MKKATKFFKTSIFFSFFVLVSITLLAVKKLDIPGGTTCSPLMKDKPETPADESANSPCECTDAGGNKWRCDNCTDGADCGEGPIHTPGPAGAGIVIIGYEEGILAYDPRQPNRAIDVADLAAVMGNKKFKLEFGKGKNNKPIPVWVEIDEKETSSPSLPPTIGGFSNIALIISSLILALGIFFGLRRRSA